MAKLAVIQNDPPPRSAARQRLAELLSQRSEIDARLRELEAAQKRLSDAQRNEDQARSALQNLDAQQAGAMVEWARTGGPAPQFDGKLRADLLRDADRFAAKAAAARQASASIAADQQREASAAAQLQPAITIAIAEIVADETAPLLAEFEEFARQFVAKHDRITTAANLVRNLAENGGAPDAMRPAFVRLEELNRQIERSLARPAPQDGAVRQNIADWSGLVSALRCNPDAMIEQPVLLTLSADDTNL